jgi:hypothetical protein
MRRQLLSYALIWLFILLVALPVAIQQVYLYEADVYGQSYIGRTPCSDLVYIYNGNNFAINCQSPYQLISSGLAPETVINAAISSLTTGGKIVIANGTYTFTTQPISLGGGNTAAIGTTSISNIDFSGFGNDTILSAGTNMNGAVFAVVNAGGWNIHDLQINGNRAHQSAGGGSAPYLWGITVSDSDGTIIQRVYVHDAKTYGISVEAINVQVLNNWVVNSNANGITVSQPSVNVLVQGNVVNGASDVGIDINGGGVSTKVEDVICTENWVYNINLGVSPFSVNAGTDIAVGDNGPAVNVTVALNNLYGGKEGISTYTSAGTNLDILLSNNLIHSTTTYGISGNTATALTIQGGLISIGTGQAVFTDSTVTDLSISGVQVQNGDTNTNDLQIGTPYVQINGGHIEGGETAIDITAADPQIVGVIILNPSYQGIELDSGATGALVTGNYVYDTASNNIGLYVNSPSTMIANNHLIGQAGIVVDTGASNVVIEGNDLRGSTYPISLHNWGNYALNSTNPTVMNNPGYNPIGPVANAISGGASGCTSSHTCYFSPWGTSSSFVKSGYYTIVGAPLLLIFYTIGSGTDTIAINGGSAFTPTIGESFLLYPGNTIAWAAYTAAPTVEWNFE